MSGTESVRLVLPAQARYLRLARLTAAGLAADGEFTVDEIDDLRVAVDEACSLLLEGCAGESGELDLRFTADGRELVVEGRCATSGSAPPELHPVARELLTVTTDRFEADVRDGDLVVVVGKLAADHAGS